MPSATDRPADHQPYVFVSYASADRARGMPVVAAMQRAGVAIWLDQQGLKIVSPVSRSPWRIAPASAPRTAWSD